ncbi:MAG: general secretion pathway protein GspK [Pseudomonadota bacterium]
MRGRQVSRQAQRGAALILVLWTALLLSVLLAGAIAASRIEARIAAADEARFRADLALDAGLDLAAWNIAAAEADLPDGPIVAGMALNGYSVTVERSIEGEKLDVNRADEAVIRRFFEVVGLKTADADRLAAEIADWRDQDDLPRPNGAEASDYAQRTNKRIGDRPFNSIEDLKSVLHMTPALFDCIAPALTIFGSGEAPSARVMALIGKPPINDAAAARAVLGTSVRGATAGGVHVLEATAVQTNGNNARPRTLTRVIRITGTPDEPFAQIAEFRNLDAGTRRCEAAE